MLTSCRSFCCTAGEQYGPWFLFSLFAAILVWEEVWDLPHTAALSGWLLLLITAGAVSFSTVFERRYWCRYGGGGGALSGWLLLLLITAGAVGVLQRSV